MFDKIYTVIITITRIVVIIIIIIIIIISSSSSSSISISKIGGMYISDIRTRNEAVFSEADIFFKCNWRLSRYIAKLYAFQIHFRYMISLNTHICNCIF